MVLPERIREVYRGEIMTGDKGLVSASIIKDRDRYKILFFTIALGICFGVAILLSYNVGIIKGEQIADAHIESIRETFAAGEPFVLFGEYRVFRANIYPDFCYAVAKSRGRNDKN